MKKNVWTKNALAIRLRQSLRIVALVVMTLAMPLSALDCYAEGGAEITFDEVSHDFGTFSEKSPKVKHTFTYTNTGDAPLVVNQCVASCGCTVAEYTKKPIAPGEKGEISVTYNGAGRSLGHFKKTVTVRTNGIVEIVRLSIMGEMTE